MGLIPENELTQRAGIALDRRTKGAGVDSDRETEAEGIFACGNVLHVHDLVDFVSEEAETAGAAAAEYVLHGEKQKDEIPSVAGEYVSYVLPQRVNRLAGKPQKLYFRVNAALKNVTVKVKCGADEKSYKKIGVAPGEMESVLVRPEVLKEADSVKISVEVNG